MVNICPIFLTFLLKLQHTQKSPYSSYFLVRNASCSTRPIKPIFACSTTIYGSIEGIPAEMV